tara:strand:- start:483 stop:1220 length:738 start_codon:yes stop_codon:yes gene_type:complete
MTDNNLSLTDELNLLEARNTGTSPTKNKLFDEQGYLIIRNLWDSKELYDDLPKARGQLNYFDHGGEPEYIPVEQQVNGSLARYNHPKYREIHKKIGIKIGEIIGKKVYKTYFYDRFYFESQQLEKHIDRPSCEISVSVHIRTNMPKHMKDWPFGIQTPSEFTEKKNPKLIKKGKDKYEILKEGDGLIYKGTERPHWRDPLPALRKRDKVKRAFTKKEFYYHQIFFHYVLQDGERAHYAFDSATTL